MTNDTNECINRAMNDSSTESKRAFTLIGVVVALSAVPFLFDSIPIMMGLWIWLPFFFVGLPAGLFLSVSGYRKRPTMFAVFTISLYVLIVLLVLWGSFQ